MMSIHVFTLTEICIIIKNYLWLHFFLNKTHVKAALREIPHLSISRTDNPFFEFHIVTISLTNLDWIFLFTTYTWPSTWMKWTLFPASFQKTRPIPASILILLGNFNNQCGGTKWSNKTCLWVNQTFMAYNTFIEFLVWDVLVENIHQIFIMQPATTKWYTLILCFSFPLLSCIQNLQEQSHEILK